VNHSCRDPQLGWSPGHDGAVRVEPSETTLRIASGGVEIEQASRFAGEPGVMIGVVEPIHDERPWLNGRRGREGIRRWVDHYRLWL
jgi:hypothetical protein